MKRKKRKGNKIYTKGVFGAVSARTTSKITSMADFETTTAARIPRKRTKYRLKQKSSLGENKIAAFLTKRNIKFAREHEFADCLSPNQVPYRFDFFIEAKNTVIEFDGKQHFEAAPNFHGKDADEQLAKQKMYDRQKDRYCKEKGILMIRIAYFDIKKVGIILSRHFPKEVSPK
jgi:very-short-patch-repair endonuclease